MQSAERRVQKLKVSENVGRVEMFKRERSSRRRRLGERSLRRKC